MGSGGRGVCFVTGKFLSLFQDLYFPRLLFHLSIYPLCPPVSLGGAWGQMEELNSRVGLGQWRVEPALQTPNVEWMACESREPKILTFFILIIIMPIKVGTFHKK